METTFKVHSVNSDDYKMWRLEGGSPSCPIPIRPSARSFIAQMLIACLLCAGHWSSRVQQWTGQPCCQESHVPCSRGTVNKSLPDKMPGGEICVSEACPQSYYQKGSQPEDQFFSITSLSSSGPILFCSKDSIEEVKHIERKSYCSRFPVFKTP